MADPREVPFNEWQRKFAEQLAANPRIRELTSQMAAVVAPALEAFAGFQVAYTKAIEPYLESIRRFQKSLVPALEKLAAAQRAWYELQLRYVEVMLEAGWPPVMDVPIFLVHDVVRSFDSTPVERRTAAVDAVLEVYFGSDKIQELFAGWDTYLLRKRMHVLGPALRAHLADEWVLSVPVLLATLEGVVAETGGVKGHMNMAKYKKAIEATFESGWSDEQVQRRVGAAMQAFYLDIVLRQFVHGDPIPIFSRHAILHGADLGYGTRANSIKAFLLLDLIQQRFGTVVLVGRSVYHRPECGTLRAAITPGIYFTNDRDAVGVGARPCRLCH